MFFFKEFYYKGKWIQVILFHKFNKWIQVRTRSRHSFLQKKSAFMTLPYTFLPILINSFRYLKYAQVSLTPS